MSQNESSRADRVFAATFSWGSRSLKHVPWLDELIVGPNVVPEGWQRLHRSDLLGTPNWLTAPGDPRGPWLPIPSRYRLATVLAIDKAQMQAARGEYEDPRDALLLRFGGELVVGAMAPGERFVDRTDPFHVNKVSAALRAGRGEQPVVAGVYAPLEREFTPVSTQHDKFVPVGLMPANVPIL